MQKPPMQNQLHRDIITTIPTLALVIMLVTKTTGDNLDRRWENNTSATIKMQNIYMT